MTPDELDIWQNLPYSITETARDIALPTRKIKTASASMYTSVPIGLWYSPIDKAYALEVPESASPQDIQFAKAAIDSVGNLADLEPDYEDGYIKVASTPYVPGLPASRAGINDNPYVPEAQAGVPVTPTSEPVRRLSEYLQFTPKKYSGDVIPGYGPVNGMLAGGLVGAGLGYGAGWLGEKLLPEKWKKNRLRKTLGLLGGAVGATPGALFAAVNMSRGRSPWDNAMFSDQVMNKQGKLSSRYKEAGEAGSLLVWESRREAFESAFDMEGVKMASTGTDNFDINVDEMGRTLWEVGSDPQTAATTMGAVYAAQQMPTRNSRPGFVTPTQMANLGVHMGVGSVSGGLVGAALGALTGADAGTKNRLKQTGMYLGIVRAVVPKLFG